MISTGPNLGLLINAATGDQHDTAFRKFLRAFDALVLLMVKSRTLAAPPGSPANGDRYIVGPSPTGAWSGHANAVAVWTTDDPAAPSGEWEFYVPNAGFMAYSLADLAFYGYSSGAWSFLGSSTLASDTDVAIASPLNNDVLTYETSSSKWKNKPSTAGSSTLASDTDVVIASPANNDVLTYETSSSKWKNKPSTGGSFGGLPVYSSNVAALGGGLLPGALYRTGTDPDSLCVVDAAAVPIALIAHSGANDNGSGGAAVTPAIDTTGATLLVVVTSVYAGNGSSNLTDSKGNTWVPMGRITGQSGEPELLYCWNPTVGTGHTFSAHDPWASGTAISVAAFSHVKHSADPLVGGTYLKGTRANSATQQPGSDTPVTGQLVITGLGVFGNSNLTYSVDLGFAVVDMLGMGNGSSNYVQSGLAYLVAPSGSAVNPTATLGVAQTAQALIAIFDHE